MLNISAANLRKQFVNRDPTLDGKFLSFSLDGKLFNIILLNSHASDQHQFLSAVTTSILHLLKFFAIFNTSNDSVTSVFITWRRRSRLLSLCAKQAISRLLPHVHRARHPAEREGGRRGGARDGRKRPPLMYWITDTYSRCLCRGGRRHYVVEGVFFCL